MLVRLLYASRATGQIDEALVASILEKAHAYNAAHGLTGILCTSSEGNVFLQVLEGGRPAVNELYGRILRDPRHQDVILLDYAEIADVLKVPIGTVRSRISRGRALLRERLS